MSTTWKLYDRFFLILANKPQSSLVLYLKVWSRSWRTKCLSGLTVKCNANAKRICESWRTNRVRVPTDYLLSARMILAQSFMVRKWVIRNLRRIQFAIQEELLYAEYGATLKNFYLSKLLCFCSSLFETHLNKAKYSIYEKLSTVFKVSCFRFEEK